MRTEIKTLKSIQQDLTSNDLFLNEAIDVAQNHPLWRLISTFGANTLLVVHTRKDDLFEDASYCLCR